MRRQMTEEEAREFVGKVNSHYQADLVLEGILFSKDEKRGAKKIFFFTGSHVPKAPAEWMGQHFGTVEADGGITLSIEGAQKVGETTEKTIELRRDEAEEVFAGKDIEVKTLKADGFYILKTGGDVIGVGKIEKNKLINQTPKSRRTHQQYRD